MCPGRFSYKQVILTITCIAVGLTISRADSKTEKHLFGVTSKTVLNNLFATIVRGKVQDSNGQPLVGVSIQIKGQNTGTSTDKDGSYTISVPENGSLVFSYVGFKTKEYLITASTGTLDVTLDTDAKSLDEVVVIGYGTAKKSDLTGSVSSVSAGQIAATPVATIDGALQGRASGVNVVSNNGSPGAGIGVQIRGVGSFGNNGPLYVVDGYPISGGLNSINPSDIQSMDILKDASAAAIYGNRASNGVIIITTKRGSNRGGVQINFDALSSVQSKPQRYDVLNAQQFIDAAIAVNTAEGYSIPADWKTNGSAFYNDKNIDWQNAFYQVGLKQQYSLALRGGGPQVQSSLSLGYFDQDGIVKFSKFKRYNANLNLDYTPYKWLKATTSLNYANTNRDARAGGLQSFINQQPLLTGRPGVYQIKDANGVYGFATQGNNATNGGVGNNYYAQLEENRVDNPNDNFRANVGFEATVIPGLKVKTSFGANLRTASSISFQSSNDRVPTGAANTLATYSQSNNTSSEWLWTNTLSYNKILGKHEIDVLGGIEAQKNKFRNSGSGGNGSLSNDVLNAGSLTQITSATGYTEFWSLASQFGRVNYKFADKYILTGTVRRDGSSRFGPGKKYGVFPSAGVAWKAKEESFLKNVKAINNLKFRASWGQAGNQDVPLFAYQGVYVANNNGNLNNDRGYVFGKVYSPGLSLNTLPNPELTWETNTTTDIGFDLGLFNRFTLTAAYYKRVSSDFLLNVPVPAQTGFQNAQRNVGEMQNSGIELDLQYSNNTKPFKWTVGVNASTVKNKINSFTDGLSEMFIDNQLGFRNYGANTWTQYALSRVGHTIGEFYGYKTAGIFQDQASIDALNAAAVAKYGAGKKYQVTSTSPGDRKFVDLNNDGVISDADRTFLGNPLPKVFGGLTFDASYKNFDFNMFIYTSIGNDVLNYARRNMENFDYADGVGLQNFGTEFYTNRWTASNHSNTYTRLIGSDKNGNNRVSDAYLEDGSYARLRNIQLGYTLSPSVARSIHASKLRFYLSAQNLFTLTNYSGLDPEIGTAGSSNGVDQGNYPTSKFVTLGLNVGF